LGAPIEFKSWERIQRRFGPKGVTRLEKALGRRGSITDDTQMTLFTAEGILRASNHRERLPTSGRTFHPKLYLGASARKASAVNGSANLTGGLVTNFEAAVALTGTWRDEPLARAWAWAEELWGDGRAEPWTPQTGDPVEEPFEPELYAALPAEVRRDPVFTALARPSPNRVVELTPVEVHVETTRSLRMTGGTEPIPAWMFHLAWDRLRTHGTLSSSELLNDMRVHRSSAVCAMLARLPPIERVPGRGIVLRWRGPCGNSMNRPN